MLIRQLSALALSALMSVIPVNFYTDPNAFPETRVVNVWWTTKVDVTDLGYKTNVDAPQGLINNGLDEQDAEHYFLISYTHTIQCNQACFVKPDVSGYQLTDSSYVIYSHNRYSGKASDLYPLLDFAPNGSKSQSITYNSESDVGSISLTIPRYNGNTYNTTVYLPYATQGQALEDIRNWTNETYWVVLASAMMNTNNYNVPTSVMTNYKNYVDNGEYATAYYYIYNYYLSEAENNNTNINNTVNNYNSKETDLQSVVDTENNFSIGIENDFNQRMQNISTENNITTVSPFVTSANWVKQQFDRLTVGTVFGSALSFALLIGLAMALIGRIL